MRVQGWALVTSPEQPSAHTLPPAHLRARLCRAPPEPRQVLQFLQPQLFWAVVFSAALSLMYNGVPFGLWHLRSKVLRSYAESPLVAGHGSSQMPGANNELCADLISRPNSASITTGLLCLMPVCAMCGIRARLPHMTGMCRSRRTGECSSDWHCAAVPGIRSWLSHMTGMCRSCWTGECSSDWRCAAVPNTSVPPHAAQCFGGHCHHRSHRPARFPKGPLSPQGKPS